MSKYPIPEATLQQHIIALGKTGSGKSSALRVIVEQMLTDQLPLCIVDPKGDWWGIKLSADGKKPGFPLVIFGGKHADVPINEHSGGHVAELVASGNRPAIIDLGGWMPGARTRFFIDFASTLFRTNAGQRWLLIDECHNFAPKGKVLDPAAGKMLHWANRLASEGRGLGVNIIGASQRPQKVHNDFLTSCETLIAMKVLHASDRIAYKDWIDGCGDPEKGKEMLKSIANLKKGSGWVWSPEIEFGPELVKFPMFKTYDSFKPQPPGAADNLTGWAAVDLDDVRAKLAKVVKEAEDNDPRLLKKQIADLKRELAKPRAAVPDSGAIEAERQKGFDAGTLQGRAQAYREIDDKFRAIKQDIHALCARFETVILEAAGMPAALGTVTFRDNYRIDRAPAPSVDGTEKLPRPYISINYVKGSGKSDLPIGERAILIACAQYVGGCDREQLSILAGYKRSSRDTYIQRLKEKGFLAVVDTRLKATEAGFVALGDFDRLPTGEALQQYWLGRLPEGERRIFAQACGYYPGAISRDQLSELTGYKRSSRDTYIQRLRSRELISTEGGEIRASATLFD